MKQSLRLLNIGLLFLALAFLWLMETSLLHHEYVQWGFFALVMVVTGIPHGAVDHLVFFSKKSVGWKRFLGLYLGLIVLYGLLWYLLPEVSLIVFFVMTCFHFGQSEWHFLALSEKSLLKIWVYCTWGLWLLLTFFYFNPGTSILILEGFVDRVFFLKLMKEQGGLLLYVMTASWLVPVVFILVKKQAQSDAVAFNLLLSLMLFVCIVKMPLPISFALYFGGWHALKAIQEEREALFGQQEKGAVGRWIRAAIPFSVLSFFGIGLLVWLALSGVVSIHPAMIFFIAISVLTLPHMLIMRFVYNS